jgi:uroporphyrinogen decarboxylase
MSLINKAKEIMSSRERVKRTFNLEKTDRVTIGYEANMAIHQKLSKAFGIHADNIELLYQALGVDYRSIEVPYTGPCLFSVPENRQVNQLEGSIMRWIDHSTGGYWDFCDFPLKDAVDEAFYRFPVPDPDHFDYDAAYEKMKYYDNQYGLYIGNPGVPDVINSNGRIMSMEDILCHLATGNEAALDLVRRRVNFQLNMMERLLDKCKGQIDFIWLGEDLGTQIGPMISLELYRRVLKPIHKSYADLAKAYKIPVIIHTCGSSSWAYEDFIKIGITGVDTLQPEAVNMSPEYLKKHFGGRLCFRGCISTAGSLAYGTVLDVEEDCKHTLEIMMEGYGYHFATTHAIQDNSPVENVIAMYNAAHKFGVY